MRALLLLLAMTAARAEERHFTSEPIDTAGNYKIIYAPILMVRLGESHFVCGVSNRDTF